MLSFVRPYWTVTCSPSQNKGKIFSVLCSCLLIALFAASCEAQTSLNMGIYVDQSNADNGTGFDPNHLPYGISFGGPYSGEAIGSARVSGSPNLYGLDFYTGFAKRMSISQSGDVTIVNGALVFPDNTRLTSASSLNGNNISIGGTGPAGLVVSGSNLDPRGYNMATLGGTGTFAGSGRLLLGWNLSQGGGEQDLISNRGGGGSGGFSFYDYDNNNNLVQLVSMSPSQPLAVSGSITLAAGSGGSLTFPDTTVQSTAWNGVLSGGDYAESVNVSGDRGAYEPGDVLVIDPISEGNFLRSFTPYSTTVTGIYSSKPGVVGRRQLTARTHMKEEVPMAMTGIVPTKVSAENGAIKPGDLLVTSSKSGYAMKGTDRTQMLGAVIGKAIGHLDSGVGIIEAVVTLQ